MLNSKFILNLQVFINYVIFVKLRNFNTFLQAVYIYVPFETKSTSMNFISKHWVEENERQAKRGN